MALDGEEGNSVGWSGDGSGEWNSSSDIERLFVVVTVTVWSRFGFLWLSMVMVLR